MALFVLAVGIVFLVTAGCALIEAALYAVRRPYIHRLIAAEHPAGKRLKSFKEKMDYPITAILIFDTLLGVGGATIAGAQARVLFGEAFVYWFTLALAAALLVFAQIVPKIVGVAYNQPIARNSAFSVSIAILLLYPIVRAIEFFTRHLKLDESPKLAIEEDVREMARISVEEGSILGIEAELIQNSLALNDVRADEMMTPLNRVVSFPSNMTVRDAYQQFKDPAASAWTAGLGEHWTARLKSRPALFSSPVSK